MVVPYANRAAVAVLPGLALSSKKPATVKEVIEDFSKQVPSPHKSSLECVQLVKGKTIKVHFPSANIMEDILHGGLTFRGHPLEFKDPSQHRWVTLLDLPYGIPPASISSSLVKYGKIKEIKAESHLGVYTGARLLLMDVTVAIPSRVRIAGHDCTIFYRGQVRSCFKCGATGHEAKKCPRKPHVLEKDPKIPVRQEKRKRKITPVVSSVDGPNIIAHPPPGPSSMVGGMELDVPTLPSPIPPLLSSDDEFDMNLSDSDDKFYLNPEDTSPVKPQSHIPKPPVLPPALDRRPIATRMRELASDPTSGLKTEDAEAQIVKLKDWSEVLKDPACEADRLSALKEIDRLQLNLDIHFAKQALRKAEEVHLAARSEWSGTSPFDVEPYFAEFHRLEQAVHKAQQAAAAVPQKSGGVGTFPSSHPA